MEIKATERYFPVVLFVTVFKVVLTVSLTTKSCGADLSNKSYSAVLSNGAICFSAFYKMEVGNFVEFFFSICGSGRVKGT